MSGVIIGPCRIADQWGTHEPGEVIENPSPGLLELAESSNKDPETGQLYVKKLSDAKVAAAIAAEPTPEKT